MSGSTHACRLMLRIFCALCACVAPMAAHAVNEGQAAPGFKLLAASGIPVSLAQYKGKVVYLDFWASWCGPCKESLPFMNELQATLGSRGLVVLAVNIDKRREDAERMIKKVGPKFSVLYDPEGTVPAMYALPTMPSSYIIGKDGVVRTVHRGFRDGESEEIVAQIKKLMGEK